MIKSFITNVPNMKKKTWLIVILSGLLLIDILVAGILWLKLPAGIAISSRFARVTPTIATEDPISAFETAAAGSQNSRRAAVTATSSVVILPPDAVTATAQAVVEAAETALAPAASPTPESVAAAAAPALPTPTPKTPAAAAAAGPVPVYMPFVARYDPPGFLARHVIVLIGDGMGFEQVKAGGMYLNGQPGTLPFEAFPYQAQVTTYSYGGELTDSAAASTAMATGHKVENAVINEEIPGDGHELHTLLEYARDRDMSTGLVTTSPITDATPAGFGAHTSARGNVNEIASDYLNGSRPNLLFGGSGALTASLAQQAGYTVITDRTALQSLAPDSQAHISGQFAETYLPYELDGLGNAPHLSEMTEAALRVLGGDPDGFFLVIEGGRIDTAAHQNDGSRMTAEVAEFARTAQVAIDWQASHPDTIILVLADHETGGLQVTANNGAGNIPDMAWTTTGHTGVNIGLWMSGLSPEGLPAVLDNTQVPFLLTGGRFQP